MMVMQTGHFNGFIKSAAAAACHAMRRTSWATLWETCFCLRRRLRRRPDSRSLFSWRSQVSLVVGPPLSLPPSLPMQSFMPRERMGSAFKMGHSQNEMRGGGPSMPICCWSPCCGFKSLPQPIALSPTLSIGCSSEIHSLR